MDSSKPYLGEPCSTCRDLLAHMQRFFELLESAHRQTVLQWLTVEEVANELKISKNVVYGLIRNGELEAINIVNTNGKIAQRGHYRIERISLNRFIESKRIRVPSPQSSSRPKTARLPKVRNHLGL